MIRRLTVTLVCLLATQVISATETPEAVRAGRLLAEELSNLRPAENSCHSGTLKIYDGRKVRAEIPVQLRTLVTTTNWQTLYRTTGTNHAHASSLTVIYTANQPNQYQLLNPALPDGQTNQFPVLTGNDAMIPFAGSDFWLADLGLEFLRWPEQRILKKEVRRSQSCNVLESTNPNPAPGTYARVVSWIDIDTGGIVYAEAFDANRRRMKEFLPKAVKKVDGQYQVQRMEMYGSQTRSRTVLEFDFDAP